MKLLYKTKALCPICIKDIKARVLEKNSKIFFEKECKEDGKFSEIISNYPKEYRRYINKLLSNDYDFNGNLNYFLFLNMKCNLNCPICYTNANNIKYKEPDMDYIKEKIKGIRKARFFFTGGEATLRKDLPEVIGLIKKTGNVTCLLTNGIKISNYNYLKKLKNAGLDEVQISFESLDDKEIEKIRGVKITKTRLKALENLEKLKMPITLSSTIVKNINEGSMKKILDMGIKKDMVKCINFRTYSHMGKKGIDYNKSSNIEYLIKRLERQTNGRISPKGVYDFQFFLLNLFKIFSIKECPHSLFFLLFKDKKKFKTVNELIDIKSYNTIKSNNKYKILLHFFLKSLNIKHLTFILKYSPYFIINKIKTKALKPFHSSNKMLILIFHQICNSYTFDYKKKDHCNIIEISSKYGMIKHYEGNTIRENQVV